jgi:hypothetical protein
VPLKAELRECLFWELPAPRVLLNIKHWQIFIFPVIPEILLVEKFYTKWRRLTYFVAKWDDASVVGK